MPMHANNDRVDLVVLAWLWCQRGKPAKAAGVAKGVGTLMPAGLGAQWAEASLDRLCASGTSRG